MSMIPLCLHILSHSFQMLWQATFISCLLSLLSTENRCMLWVLTYLSSLLIKVPTVRVATLLPAEHFHAITSSETVAVKDRRESLKSCTLWRKGFLSVPTCEAVLRLKRVVVGREAGCIFSLSNMPHKWTLIWTKSTFLLFLLRKTSYHWSLLRHQRHASPPPHEEAPW